MEKRRGVQRIRNITRDHDVQLAGHQHCASDRRERCRKEVKCVINPRNQESNNFNNGCSAKEHNRWGGAKPLKRRPDDKHVGTYGDRCNEQG